MDYTTKLIDKRDLEGGIATLTFERPEDYDFKAGQYAYLTLEDRGFEDDFFLERPLSFASAPANGELAFATKISESGFKQTLKLLEPGETITLSQPKGDMTLPDATQTPLCFIAGGVGITPFNSMARQAAMTATGHRITLFYVNRTPAEAAFLDELVELDEKYGEFTLAASMTRVADDDTSWQGLRGRLSAEMIREKYPDWEAAHYYLAGPPPMVASAHKVIQELGIAEERITLEKFA